jgi:hypothetical protein
VELQVNASIRAKLTDKDGEDFGAIAVPLDGLGNFPVLLKHRGRHFAYEGLHADGDRSGEGILDEQERVSVPHYEEVPSASYYDHDAARGVVK